MSYRLWMPTFASMTSIGLIAYSFCKSQYKPVGRYARPLSFVGNKQTITNWHQRRDPLITLT